MSGRINLDGPVRLLHIARMNQNQENTAPSSPGRRFPAAGYLVAALLAVIVLILWRNQSAMKSNLDMLSARNAELEEKLAAAESPVEGRVRSEPASEERQAAPVAEPATETIRLNTPSVEKTAEGLTAHLEFEPDASHGPLDLIALVVRIPGESVARIVAFEPADKGRFSDIRQRVDEKGKFAIFQGTPDKLKKLRFDLTVSGPVTATVRGSKGIRAFEIIVAENGSAVRPL